MIKQSIILNALHYLFCINNVMQIIILLSTHLFYESVFLVRQSEIYNNR